MHILYEAELLGSQKHIGISNSIFQLINNIAPTDNILSVFHKNKAALFNSFANVFEPDQGSLPPAEQPSQILHSFTLANPRTRTLPWVQTIFDTIIEYYPDVLREVYPKIDTKVAELLQKTARTIAHEPNLIITPSQNTKKDLINIYKIPEKHIKVVPLAPHPAFHKISLKEKDIFLKEKKIDFPFFIFVGPRWKHKNFSTLLKAFAIFKERIDTKWQNFKLLAIGSTPVYSPEEEKLIDKHGLAADIKIIPYIEQAELNFWYNCAFALVYPSLYEGFGLPPLEAMACELPVIAANSSSLPEVTANAALSFDPQNAELLAEMLQKLLYDTPLCADLISNGKKQLENFSWQKIAEETLKLYEKIVKK